MQFRPSLPRIVALSLVAFGLVFTAAGPANADHDTTYITFEGGGFGHGVGMSQFGALGRAEAGYSAEDILAFYFDGTTVEDRGAELDEFLGQGIRVRLSPAYQSFDRPDGVTVTARDGALLTVRFDDENVHTANSIYLEQAGQIGGSSNGVTDDDDEWYWIVKLDGSDEDVCVGCIARSATIERPEGAIIDIVDDVGSQGAHDAGDLTLVGRDTATGSTPDSVFVVLQLPLEDYLQGIDEVPPDWPDEALQAQAIAARSYAVAQAISRRNGLTLDDPAYDGWTFDVFDSVQDQVYDGYEDRNGNAIEYESRLAATLATAGHVVVYDNAIVRTFYSSSNGGYTAASEDPFDNPEPFHIAKPDPFDAALDGDGIPQNPFPFRQFSYTRDALSRWFARDNFGVGIVQSITFNDPVPSGRINDITATIVGSDYPSGRVVSGSRVRWAIVNGCQEDAADPGIDFDCEDYPRSSHLRLAPPPIEPFDDVPLDHWAADGIYWSATEGITADVGDNFFAPARQMDRAEVATFIWGFWDAPQPTQPLEFSDVDPEAEYATAISWMASQKITLGVNETDFAPDRIVTRWEWAKFLWRLAGKPRAPIDERFTDIAPWDAAAVHWMLNHGITKGTTATTFSPDNPVTRAEAATFLYRLAAKPEAFAPGSSLPSTMRR